MWQQDGAFLHYGLTVRGFLKENFDKWIGRCDLVHQSLHFSLKGIQDMRVYSVIIHGV